jgi:hypothetical protein
MKLQLTAKQPVFLRPVQQAIMLHPHLAALCSAKLLNNSSIKHQTAIIRGFIGVLLLLPLTKLPASRGCTDAVPRPAVCTFDENPAQQAVSAQGARLPGDQT